MNIKIKIDGKESRIIINNKKGKKMKNKKRNKDTGTKAYKATKE